MMDGLYSPQQVFDGARLITGVSVRVEQGRVVDVIKGVGDGKAIAGCMSPGFVDLQVNGGGNVLLNGDPTMTGMAAIAAAHRRFGTVAIMPTVITDAPDVVDRAVEAAISACGTSGIIGLHIEGPHIALEKRGTHAAHHIRPMDKRTLDAVAKARVSDVPVMITVAPEATTPDQIAELSALGAVVSLGHTNATAEQIEQAVAAGAQCGTHLFNAMSPMQGREPGAVGAILNGGIPFGIICDGHHVDDRMIALALRAAAPDCAFLVSDAMATVGGASEFELYGQTIRVENGRLINAEGNLAGAHVTQAQGVQRLVNHVGVALEQALRMAITVPAQVMRQPDLATFVGRHVDDLIVIEADLSVSADLREQ